jgi:hypothetical protein
VQPVPPAQALRAPRPPRVAQGAPGADRVVQDLADRQARPVVPGAQGPGPAVLERPARAAPAPVAPARELVPPEVRRVEPQVARRTPRVRVRVRARARARARARRLAMALRVAVRHPVRRPAAPQAAGRPAPAQVAQAARVAQVALVAGRGARPTLGQGRLVGPSAGADDTRSRSDVRRRRMASYTASAISTMTPRTTNGA